MFYPAKMKHITILALDKYQEKLVTRLHELGTIEIVEIENDSREEKRNTRRREKTLSDLRKTETLLDFLTQHEKKEKFSIKKLLLEGPSKFYHNPEILCGGAQTYLSTISRRIGHLKEQLSRLNNKINKILREQEAVERFSGINLDLSEFKDTKTTFSLAGEGPGEKLDDLLSELSHHTTTHSTKDKGDITLILILGLKREKNRVLETLLRNSFDQMIVPSVKGTPSALLSNYEAKLTRLNKNKDQILKELTVLAEKEMNNLLALREYFDIEKERIEILRRFGRSKRTFTLAGYIPEKLVAKTTDEIKNVSDGCAVVKISELEKEDCEIPVMLDNPEPVRAFQLLTKAYAMPKYGELDPSWLMALWFPFFFGIMLTDAAYGVGLLALSWFIVSRFDSPGFIDIGKILAVSSVWTIILGLAFGSVFGNLLQNFFGISFGIFDPLSKADVAMLAAIIIGVVHLNIGLFLGIKRKLEQKDASGLVFEHLWILLVEISVGLILFTEGVVPQLAAGTLFAASIGILLKKPGGIGPLEITSFFGANLSYARLLALALATTGISIAVNIMGGLLLGSLVGSLFGALILLSGHIFNFTINVFGSFVHSMRLHYVEFFSMFYEGGGKEFSPFKEKRRYTKKGGV